MTQASGRHAYFLQPEHTYRERQCLGVIGLPRKIHDTSGIATFVSELVSCIWPSALALFPPCRVFQLCLVARLNTPWALGSTSLSGKLETPASQSKVRAQEKVCELGCLMW